MLLLLRTLGQRSRDTDVYLQQLSNRDPIKNRHQNQKRERAESRGCVLTPVSCLQYSLQARLHSVQTPTVNGTVYISGALC